MEDNRVILFDRKQPLRDGDPLQSTNSIFGGGDIKLASRRGFQQMERDYIYG